MATPLDDAALDTIFRTARTYNGYTDAPVTEADIRAIYDLLKMGPTSANNQAARLVWLTTPAYINLLFSERAGNLLLGGCLLWMGTGIFVMRKMINFKH